MSPANGILRVALELGALAVFGYWGREYGAGMWRYALMVGIPLGVALVWGTFTVPGDPARGKDGLVPVTGVMRLFIETTVFGFAMMALRFLGHENLSLGYGLAAMLHFAFSTDRVKWLVRQ